MADFNVFLEAATANVTIGGNTSTGSTVDAEVVWTLRDTTTGEIFQMAEFEVEAGGALGSYLMSERPMVPGRTYETLEHDTLPDVGNGDPVFSYLQQTGFESDGIVSGTAGNDTIDTSYLGDDDGDQIDNLDNITTSDSTDEILSWVAFGANGTDLTGNATQTVGGVDVSVTATDQGNLSSATVSTGAQYVGTDTFDPNSALRFVGSGGIGDTSSVTFDFSIIVDYDNGGTGGQLLNLTDLHFTTLTESGDNDDSVDAGAGDDFIDTALANDTVDGGTGG